MAAPLALDVAPHSELPGWRRGIEALDSLAYIDTFTDQEKTAVELLITDEVRALSIVTTLTCTCPADVLSKAEMLIILP